MCISSTSNQEVVEKRTKISPHNEYASYFFFKLEYCYLISKESLSPDIQVVQWFPLMSLRSFFGANNAFVLLLFWDNVSFAWRRPSAIPFQRMFHDYFLRVIKYSQNPPHQSISSVEQGLVWLWKSLLIFHKMDGSLKRVLLRYFEIMLWFIQIKRRWMSERKTFIKL